MQPACFPIVARGLGAVKNGCFRTITLDASQGDFAYGRKILSGKAYVNERRIFAYRNRPTKLPSCRICPRIARSKSRFLVVGDKSIMQSRT